MTQKTKEIKQAASALLNWLQHQDIEPEDTVPVLALAMAAMLRTLTKHECIEEKKGTRIAIKMIHSAMEQMRDKL